MMVSGVQKQTDVRAVILVTRSSVGFPSRELLHHPQEFLRFL
jgi:hypothetical protein